MSMSFLPEGRECEYEDAVLQVLKVRAELLTSFEYSKLLNLSRDEIVEFIDGVKNNPGKHWQQLSEFARLPLAERGQYLEKMFSDRESIALPPVHLQTLFRLSDVSESRKRELEDIIHSQIDKFVDVLNIERIASKSQSQYYGSVEISTAHVFSAIYDAVQRLCRFNGTIGYFRSWLLAHTSQEAAVENEARRTASKNNASLISLDDHREDDVNYAEKFGEDAEETSLEIAEASVLAAKSMYEAALEMKLPKEARQHVTKLEETLQVMLTAYQAEQLLTVQELFEDFLDASGAMFEKVPKKMRQALWTSSQERARTLEETGVESTSLRGASR